MTELSFLPPVNAVLNTVAATLLITGRCFIRQGRVDAHRRVMLGAFAVSSVFLACYVLHKVSRDFENTAFHAEGVAQAAYLLFLFSHVTLAATVPFLAITLIAFGLRGAIHRHRRLARIAWPLWLYVSVTGVMIYFLLYWLNPVLASST